MIKRNYLEKQLNDFMGALKKVNVRNCAKHTVPAGFLFNKTQPGLAKTESGKFKRRNIN